MEVRSFNTPDEVRNFAKGKLDLVKIGGAVVGRGVFEDHHKACCGSAVGTEVSHS